MRKFWLSAVILLAGTPVFSNYDLQQVLNELETRQNALRSIQFNFQQEIKFASLEKPSIIKGQAVFAKKGRLQIEKTFPDQQFTYSDGNKVWIYSPAYHQVWVGSSENWLTSTVLPKGLVPLNDYLGDLKKSFNLRLMESSSLQEGEVGISAEPKDKRMDYQLELIFSTDTWLPRTTIFKSVAAKIITKISHVSTDQSYSEQFFRFSPPKGTEVISLN